MRAVRLLSATALAVAVVSCAEQPLVRKAGYARIPLAPLFAVAPQGGPNIDIKKIRGVLYGTSDSSVAEALVEGDSAILEFQSVVVHGDSSSYVLNVTALDVANVVVFSGVDTLSVKPGDNAPATPDLEYVAPDTLAASVDISVAALALDWQGASTSPNVCLNKIPNGSAKTDSLLSVTGKTAGNVNVPNVRVGWTSRDTTAFTVDTAGRVRSKCSNKSAYLVAKTFLSIQDSILVTVTAPAFSLTMTPDSTNVARGATAQLSAQVVDETGYIASAASVTWFSADTTRAKVSATGLVTGVSNGRVLITAASGGRTTVGVVQVVRPLAAQVIALPTVTLDSLGIGQTRGYFAKARDAANKVIPEAQVFAWTSTATGVATVNPTTGVATAIGVGTTKIIASLDGKADTIDVQVLTAMPQGFIKSKLTNAADNLPISGASLVGSSGVSTTTAADGGFTLGGLQNGDTITITKTGFVTTVAYNIPAFPNKTLEVPAASLSPTGGTGSITGKVVNAVTNSVVSGITVKGYKGINAGPSSRRPNPTPDFTETTNASGIFTAAGKAAGTYTLVFSAPGYSETFSGGNSVSGQTDVINDVLIAPTAVGGGIYIVVTWGKSGVDCSITANNIPCNLDAHLTGPKISPDTGRFQVLTGTPRYLSGTDTIANLDVAANNGRGPEILSLRPAAAVGMYRFYVHNATLGTGSNLTLADSSQARVDVYQDGQQIGTFFPPVSQAGNVWNVFDYDGARLLPVGTITTEANPAVLSVPPASLMALPRASAGRAKPTLGSLGRPD
jgi:uncharacterized protein YjdB